MPAAVGGPGEITEVTVGVIPIVDVAPIYLGKEKGFFRERGIDLKMATADGGAAIVPGVVSGQFDFGFSNIVSLLTAQTKKVPIQVVASGVASTGETGLDFGAVVVKDNSPIKSAADLAGKKIAINSLKNIGDVTIRESVRKAGGDPAGIKFVQMPFPQMLAGARSRRRRRGLGGGAVPGPARRARAHRVVVVELRGHREGAHHRGLLHLDQARPAEPRPGQPGSPRRSTSRCGSPTASPVRSAACSPRT